MPEQRMSLEEAGKLLGGLHPNTVRNRAAKGKIPYEKDNTGKWFVFLDPEKIANDAKAKPPKSPPMEATMEPPLEPQIVSTIKTLELTIQTLNEELEAVRGERDGLRERADKAASLEAQAAGLIAQLETAELRHAEWKSEAQGTIGDLRKRLDDLTDENRKLLQDSLQALTTAMEKSAAAAAQAAQEAPRGFFGWFRRKSA